MELGIVFGVLLGSLICGWLGWRSWKATVGFGTKAVEAGVLASRGQTIAVGQVQLFGMGLAAPLLAIGVVFVPACLFELGERTLKKYEARAEALTYLEQCKATYADFSAGYAKVKPTLSRAKQKDYEQEVRRLKWYAEQTPEEVTAEADAFLPDTHLGRFWNSDLQQRNNRIAAELSEVRRSKVAEFVRTGKSGDE